MTDTSTDLAVIEAERKRIRDTYLRAPPASARRPTPAACTTPR